MCVCCVASFDHHGFVPDECLFRFGAGCLWIWSRKDRVVLKAVVGSVVSSDLNHLGHSSTCTDPLRLDDVVDAGCNLLRDVILVALLMAAHGEFCQAAECEYGRCRVDGCDASTVAGVETVQQSARLFAADLAQHDAVWAHTKCVLQ